MAGFRVLLIFLIVSTSAWAQDGRYIISFTDKNNTPYSIGQPEAFLSARSITRRSHSNIAVTSEDLPVTPSYVTQVRAKGAKAFFTSRWMNAVLVEGSSSVIAAVASLPFVLKTELVAPGKKLIGGRSKFLTQTNTTNAEASTTQLEMLGLDFMHEDGYLGEGILISILDGGFSGANTATAFQSVYAEGRIGMTQDFVTNSGNANACTPSHFRNPPVGLKLSLFGLNFSIRTSVHLWGSSGNAVGESR